MFEYTFMFTCACTRVYIRLYAQCMRVYVRAAWMYLFVCVRLDAKTPRLLCLKSSANPWPSDPDLAARLVDFYLHQKTLTNWRGRLRAVASRLWSGATEIRHGPPKATYSPVAEDSDGAVLVIRRIALPFASLRLIWTLREYAFLHRSWAP